jgi:hypothetical protein
MVGTEGSEDHLGSQSGGHPCTTDSGNSLVGGLIGSDFVHDASDR